MVRKAASDSVLTREETTFSIHTIRRLWMMLTGKRKREDLMAAPARTRSNTVIHRPDWAMAATDNPINPPPDQEKKEPLTLLTLPADIRNMIYDLTCVHHENRGIIAPVLVPSDNRYQITTHAIANGECQFLAIDPRSLADVCDNNHRRYYPPEDQPDPVVLVKQHLADGGSPHDYLVSVREDGMRNYREPEVYRIQHLCARRCFCPLAIAGVNRLLREEALSYFYGANKFYFACGSCDGIEQVYSQWWRRVGAETLRKIEHIELVRYERDSVYGTGVRQITDRITVRRIGGSALPTVTFDNPATDSLCSLLRGNQNPLSRKPMSKRNAWRDVRGHCIAELYKREIETKGLLAGRLEMLLLARRWFGREVRTSLHGTNKVFLRMMNTFMEDMEGGKKGRAGKGRKMRMLAEGEVGLEVHIDPLRKHGPRVRVAQGEEGLRFGIRGEKGKDRQC